LLTIQDGVRELAIFLQQDFQGTGAGRDHAVKLVFEYAGIRAGGTVNVMLDALIFIDRSIVTVLVFNQLLAALADFGVRRSLRLQTILPGRSGAS
jgi:hypothetical protein